jgi:hypothetical protein
MFAPTSKKITKDDNGRKILLKVILLVLYKRLSRKFYYVWRISGIMEVHLDKLKKQGNPIQPFILVVGSLIYF